MDEESKTFHCPIDNCTFSKKKGFKKKLLLNQHLLNCHSEKRYKCRNCRKQYAIEWQLKYHLKVCGRDWQCLSCDKVYKERLSLIMHCNRNNHLLPNNAMINSINESQNKFIIVPMYFDANELNLNENAPSRNEVNSGLILSGQLNGDCLTVSLLPKKSESKYRLILPKNGAQLVNSTDQELELDDLNENSSTAKSLMKVSSTTNNSEVRRSNDHISDIVNINDEPSTSEILNGSNGLIDNFCQTDDLCQCSLIDQPTSWSCKRNKSINTSSVQCPGKRADSTSSKRQPKSTVAESHTQTYDSCFVERPIVKHQSTCTEINSDTFLNLKRKSVASETAINNLNLNYCFFNEQANETNQHMNLIYTGHQNEHSILNAVDHSFDYSTAGDSTSSLNEPNRSLLDSLTINPILPDQDPLLSTSVRSVQTDLKFESDRGLLSEMFNDFGLEFNDIETQTYWNSFIDNTTQTEDFSFDDNIFC